MARLKVRLGLPRVSSYRMKHVFNRVVIDLIVCLFVIFQMFYHLSLIIFHDPSTQTD